MPFRIFPVRVVRVTPLSPSFVRVTLGGESLRDFADNGFDQRFKLILPLPGRGVADLPTTADWYAQWRALPTERQNPIRTYTVRAVRTPSAGTLEPGVRTDGRPHQAQPAEVDFDVALHGVTGPASKWAGEVQPGDELAVYGPDALYGGVHGGIDFHPPAVLGSVLLAGDETAVPAIAGILERLPADAQGVALLEVPVSGDRFPIAAPAGMQVTWLPRDGAAHGVRLIEAVRAAAERMLPVPVGAGASTLEDVDVDQQLLWEVPEAVPDGRYAWLAGEAGVIKTLRRALVTEYGLDRRSVAFMGYWRQGKAEGA
ncbi:MAG: siderophore-interacting protein [Hamadaea sp.]|uniref:siderophore-interacting protein n=1 Tax=Hamadaea sp. TaxID=2024425 RepID=UPI001810A2BB|nr:siderophore-interacting protein [Hamadaea sp.]NUR73173.1 siderophore-interacting protein [Hamadaea sp.]NUT18461.1 siderophore-interacting protein [Hamadaea sp.]